MNDDIVGDLKQFIARAISRQTSHFMERFDQIDQRFDRVYERFDRIDIKIDGILNSVAKAVDDLNEVNDSLLKDHESQIVKLEQKAV